jgi:hypothetical protein
MNYFAAGPDLDPFIPGWPGSPSAAGGGALVIVPPFDILPVESAGVFFGAVLGLTFVSCAGPLVAVERTGSTFVPGAKLII